MQKSIIYLFREVDGTGFEPAKLSCLCVKQVALAACIPVEFSVISGVRFTYISILITDSEPLKATQS